MALRTPIQWCDTTANPVMGCDGCELWPTHGQGLADLTQLIVERTGIEAARVGLKARAAAEPYLDELRRDPIGNTIEAWAGS